MPGPYGREGAILVGVPPSTQGGVGKRAYRACYLHLLGAVKRSVVCERLQGSYILIA